MVCHTFEQSLFLLFQSLLFHKHEHGYNQEPFQQAQCIFVPMRQILHTADHDLRDRDFLHFHLQHDFLWKSENCRLHDINYETKQAKPALLPSTSNVSARLYPIKNTAYNAIKSVVH